MMLLDVPSILLLWKFPGKISLQLVVSQVDTSLDAHDQ